MHCVFDIEPLVNNLDHNDVQQFVFVFDKTRTHTFSTLFLESEVFISRDQMDLDVVMC